eukprot:XP_001705362.1 Hypothetical protein GL50803_27703 [Giardia lamblia ATCC 50803]
MCTKHLVGQTKSDRRLPEPRPAGEKDVREVPLCGEVAKAREDLRVPDEPVEGARAVPLDEWECLHRPLFSNNKLPTPASGEVPRGRASLAEWLRRGT